MKPATIDPYLDKQYNARASVADCLPYLNEYTDYSRQARKEVDSALSVPYGAHPDETLDIFRGTRDAAPVYFFIHGGYWRALSKDDSSFMAPAMTRAGALVVSINYSLAPAVSVAHIVDQCRRALAWVYRNIHRYGGDPARIHVSGSSAGGHLAGMLLAGGWQAQFDLPADVVHSASPISGLFDLRPLVQTHINEWAAFDAQSSVQASPIFHLPRLPCSMLLAWGEHETDEFKQQSRQYGTACRQVGCMVTELEVSGTNHFNILMQLRQPDSSLCRPILGLMGL
jgi:arylformamidase